MSHIGPSYGSLAANQAKVKIINEIVTCSSFCLDCRQAWSQLGSTSSRMGRSSAGREISRWSLRRGTEGWSDSVQVRAQRSSPRSSWSVRLNLDWWTLLSPMPSRSTAPRVARLNWERTSPFSVSDLRLSVPKDRMNSTRKCCTRLRSRRSWTLSNDRSLRKAKHRPSHSMHLCLGKKCKCLFTDSILRISSLFSLCP